MNSSTDAFVGLFAGFLVGGACGFLFGIYSHVKTLKEKYPDVYDELMYRVRTEQMKEQL